ncbi:MAG: hypothetical protein ABL953_04480 [Ilumatobacteraceae bacterium]
MKNLRQALEDILVTAELDEHLPRDPNAFLWEVTHWNEDLPNGYDILEKS